MCLCCQTRTMTSGVCHKPGVCHYDIFFPHIYKRDLRKIVLKHLNLKVVYMKGGHFDGVQTVRAVDVILSLHNTRQ